MRITLRVSKVVKVVMRNWKILAMEIWVLQEVMKNHHAMIMSSWKKRSRQILRTRLHRPGLPWPRRRRSRWRGWSLCGKAKKVGDGSWHFHSSNESPTGGCYRDYSKYPYKLGNGARVPARKTFSQCSYDPKTRTFRAVEDWAPTTLNGASKIEY